MSAIAENTSKNTHNVVAELLAEQSCRRVLDVPAGAGAFTQRLLEAGVDVYSGDIENILQVDNPHFQQLDMNQPMPFADGFFDAVACIDGIEHLQRPFDFIGECRRIMREGGVIILSTPNINALRSRWRWFWTSHHNKCKSPLNENDPNPLHHINMMSYQRLRYILHTHGFKIEKVVTNRVKPIGWLYAAFVPMAYAMTRWVYGKEEKDAWQTVINREILCTLFSPALLFGETMIIKAVAV